MAKAGVWDPQSVLEQNPVRDDTPFSWAYLSQSEHTTINVVHSNGANMPHIHETHDEVLVVIHGQGVFRLGDETVPFKQGDVVFIPAGLVHTPITDQYIAAVSIYSPEFDPENPDRVFISE